MSQSLTLSLVEEPRKVNSVLKMSITKIQTDPKTVFYGEVTMFYLEEISNKC